MPGAGASCSTCATTRSGARARARRASRGAVQCAARCGGGGGIRDPHRVDGRPGSRQRTAAIWLRRRRGREGPFDLVVDTLGASSPLKVFAKSRERRRPLAFGAIWATVPWVDDGFDARALMQRYQQASVMIGVLPIGRQRRGRAGARGVLLEPQGRTSIEALQARGLDGVEGAGARALAGDGAASRCDRQLRRADARALCAPHAARCRRARGSPSSATARIRRARSSGRAPTWRCSMRGRCSWRCAIAERCRRRRSSATRRCGAGMCGSIRRCRYAFTPFYQSDSTVLPVMRDVVVSYVARVPPAPQFLAAMVAGSLLSPIRRLELKRPPVLGAEISSAYRGRRRGRRPWCSALPRRRRRA